MKGKKIIIALILLMLFGLMIVRIFSKARTQPTQQTQVTQATQYWTCAMHPSVKSDKPGKCPLCGMDLIPVETQVAAEMKAEKAVKAERKLLYYRNPMDPRITSPMPMKDPMGMDYIPVYEEKLAKQEDYYGCRVKEFGHCPHCDEGKPDAQCICGEHKFMVKGEMKVCPVCARPLKKLSKEETASISKNIAGSLALSKRQMELSGIATVKVVRANIFKEIRTVGKIAYDPELTIAQEEYLISLETYKKVTNSPDNDVVRRAKDLVEKSKFRLKVLGMSDAQLEELAEAKESQRSLILPEDKVWVYADIYEYELSWIKEGLPVRVTTSAYAGEEFKGVIRAINSILDPATRSVRVRIEIDNPMRKLKPEMFVDVFIQADLGVDTLALRREAILDTGSRKIVWVDKGGGAFEAREITAGPEGIALIDEQKVKVFPVISGLLEGEFVVTKGNFLLDSQSQLTGGMSVLWGGATEIKEEHRH